MRYSKANVEAVFERLDEYVLTIESGEWAFGNCGVCNTTNRYGKWRHKNCNSCLLNGMPSGNKRAPCITFVRKNMCPYAYEEHDDAHHFLDIWHNFENPHNTMENIKTRYQELCEHLAMNGYYYNEL